MKFTEELKKKLGDENFKLIEAELKGKEVYLLDPKDYLPADKITELRNDQKKLKTDNEKLTNDLTASKTEVETLKKEKENGSQTTDQQISALKKELEDFKKSNLEKDEALVLERKLGVLKSHILGAKANEKYVDVLVNNFKKDGKFDHLEIENGKIKNFDELHKPIFENYPEMYGEFKIEGGQPGGGNGKEMNLGETESMKKFKELNAKENLSPRELQTMNELAIKIKEEKNSKKET